MSTRKAGQAIRRALVGRCDFTIVSNNCWGAHVYRALGMEYRTPFVGLFVPAACYLRLLADFDALIGRPLHFVPESAYAGINRWRAEQRLSYPIARLGDAIEIDFMHYGSADEARTKWSKRVERMAGDPRRIFFKFDDKGAQPGHIAAFCRLPLANKVCFAVDTMGLPMVIRAPAEPGTGEVIDGYRLGRVSKRYFNTLRWISTWPRAVPLPSLL